MFDPSDQPRVYGLAPGIDFPEGLVKGILHRSISQPPEALARAEIIVNTRRMARRLRDIFESGPAMLLPRIRLITDLGALAPTVVQPAPMPSLRRRLELIRLITALIDQDSTLAPRASIYDLADSLASLMDEMQGEGVVAEDIATLDVSGHSQHWANSQKFLSIVQGYLEQTNAQPDTEARQRSLVQGIAAEWTLNPPQHPIILAGSTGSRGTTMLLMQAIAGLPQGALVLPGFDFDLPRQVWQSMTGKGMPPEDHPQYRFHRLLETLSLSSNDVEYWHNDAPASPERNRLVSLAMRPAPVTNAWRSEGMRLPSLDAATNGLTLVQADTPRTEALTIAMRLRQAAQNGEVAALITPDRMLSRRVSSALSRWDIIPDDSAGSPLHLSPAGRFLRHVAGLFTTKLDAEALLTLLKHPLCHSGDGRNEHLLKTQQIELQIRKHGLPYPDAAGLTKLALKVGNDKTDPAPMLDWVNWISDTFLGRDTPEDRPLQSWVEQHLELAEKLATGVHAGSDHLLWQHKAGEEARKVMDNLLAESVHGDAFSSFDYTDIVGALLSGGEVRESTTPHPDIMIWGTLEARVQGADLVILGGLNDGTWPEAPPPDPWLNRQMRHDAGLLLPERRIGLSAHDFQQAIAAPEVWLTRAIRSEDAETVPSRWLNRLSNLMNGLPSQNGDVAFADMVARGDHWLAKAKALENLTPVDPAPRPSPRPPRSARPTSMSVTEIKTLIRDPYAIYAKHGLRLRPLQPLVQEPGALLRGTVMHEIMEHFVKSVVANPQKLTETALLETANDVLQDGAPWPAVRAMWLARIERIATRFVTAELARQAKGQPIAFEQQARGLYDFTKLGVTLRGIADRIDQNDQGEVLVYDYKTGKPPTKKQQKQFDKQLLIEAAMIEEGAFPNVPATSVNSATFLGLGPALDEEPAPLEDEPPAEILKELEALIAAYLDPNKGFTARRMVERDGFAGDYDQLARFGEWDASNDAKPEDLK